MMTRAQLNTELRDRLLRVQLKGADLPLPEREYKFHKGRRWRFDYAWPACRLALEIEGGVYTGGRHVRVNGYLGDLEKYNRAALDGWRVLRIPPQAIDNGLALDLLREAMRC